MTVGYTSHKHSNDVILGSISQLPGRFVIIFLGQFQDLANPSFIPVPIEAKPEEGSFEDDGKGDNGADEEGVHDGSPLEKEVQHFSLPLYQKTQPPREGLGLLLLHHLPWKTHVKAI